MKKIIFVGLATFCLSSFASVNHPPDIKGFSGGVQGGLGVLNATYKSHFNSGADNLQEDFNSTASNGVGLIGANIFYNFAPAHSIFYSLGASFNYLFGQNSQIQWVDASLVPDAGGIVLHSRIENIYQFDLLARAKHFVTQAFDVFLGAGFSLINARSKIEASPSDSRGVTSNVLETEKNTFLGGKLELGAEYFLTQHSSISGDVEYALYGKVNQKSITNFASINAPGATLSNRSSFLSLSAVMVGYNYYIG